MGKIDFKDMYSGRIDQLNINIRKATVSKNWKLKAQLEAEKEMIKKRIEKLD